MYVPPQDNMQKLFANIVSLFYTTYANCTAVKTDEQCPIETEGHTHEPEVVFAVCVFSLLN